MIEPASERVIAVDARCLQDPGYAPRGIGRHALGLLRRAPAWARLMALTDPALPPMAGAARGLFSAVYPNARFRALDRPACLISPSPMTHDPLFTARLVQLPGTLAAAVVHDFIPLAFAGHYLADPARRLLYHAQLVWLARHDLFLANSHSTAASLRATLGVPDARIRATGAPPHQTLIKPRAGALPRHVLVIGGGDMRKNVECAIRGHAACARMQQARMPLVLTGHYDPGWSAALRASVELAGGDPALLVLAGHVTDVQIAQLYHDALCLIAPSRAEGFDSPVIEAIAAGVPVLASDIDVHRELLGDPAWLFGADDPAGLARLLDAIADPARQCELVAAQRRVLPEYTAERVAARFWAPIGERLAAAPAVLRGARPRVALLSPLPPDRSGVADYTATSCAELGRLVELHVFTGANHPPPVEGAATVRPLSALPHLSARFDRVVNVLGNSHFHLEIFHYLLRHGGACIGHDSRMLGFYGILLGMDRTAAVAAAELGRPVTRAEIDGWMADEARLEALHYGEIAAAADPVIVHSPVTARLIRERHGVRPVLLPFCIQRPWDPAALARRQEARRRLGLPDGKVVIATFGYVQKSKAPEDCIWALDVLRRWGVDAALHFVGGHESGHEYGRLVDSLGLSDNVVFLGDYVSEATYRDYLVGADLGVQLRRVYLGSISGALQDCIGAGLPTVTNASLGEMLDAPSYVRCVPDALSPLLVAEALANLLDCGLARTRPEAERLAYVAAHSFADYARGLCAALGLETAA